MQSEALKPCPFCGGQAERVDIEDGDNSGGSFVHCTVCDASGNIEFEFKENFISNWNRRAALEAALSATEPVEWQRKNDAFGWQRVTVDDLEHYREKGAELRALYAAPPAPSVAVKALADAYKAGFDASSQGYNGEVFPEYEADSEWLAQRDSDLSALSAQVQDVAEGWHVAPNSGSVLIYCLKQDGWRKGEPVMVNDIMIRVENANRSSNELQPIVDAIMRALPAAPAKQEGGE